MPEGEPIAVSVAYALPEQQWVVELELPQGATVAQALRLAGGQLPLTVAQLQALPVGIYGEPVTPQTVLTDQDRVELYRPLWVDPKTARRQRAAESSATSGATAGSAASGAPEAGR